MRKGFHITERMKFLFGIVGSLFFFFVLTLQFSTTSVSREALDVSRVKDLADRSKFDLLKEDIEKITRVRVPDTPSHNDVKQYIISEIENYQSWKLEKHSFTSPTPLGAKQFTNLIATWSPASTKKNKKENERRVILAAHYDSKLFDFNFVAATDSGVACGLLLDIIRTLDEEFTRYSIQPSPRINSQLSLQIIFFDGEEAFRDWTATDSLYGSRELASKWEQADLAFKQASTEEGQEFDRKSEGIENIEVFILLDLIGAKDPVPQFRPYFPDTQDVHKQFTRLENLLVKGEMYDISNVPSDKSRNPYFSSSLATNFRVEDDHIPFLRRKVPIVHLIPYHKFPTVWHKTTDNLSAVDWIQVSNLSILFRCWVAQYFNFV